MISNERCKPFRVQQGRERLGPSASRCQLPRRDRNSNNISPFPIPDTRGREYDAGRTADRRKEAEMSSRWFAIMLWPFCLVSTGLPQSGRQDSIAEILGPARSGYARSVRAPDGTIYLLGTLKSTDGGKRLIPVEESDPPLGTQLYGTRLTSLLWRKGLFLGLYWAVDCDRPGRCVGKMWRSTDGFKTVEKEHTLVHVPEAGVVPPDEFSEVAGGGKSRHLFFHRGSGKWQTAHFWHP